jgi:glycosyltransferase involved in cell wall biosynthesis
MYTDLDSEYKNTNEFNYVIALSEFVKESYVQKGFPIENIFVAVPDIDVQRFSPKLNFYAKRPFNILYVAHTQPLKGLHYLLDAWKNFKDADATLTIVGGFAAMPETLKQKYMSQIESDERITYIADTQEPEKYYHDASLLVFPSLTEGFGRVTLEAMACGIPVITTENARGIVEDGKTGFVVPIRSAEQIREKIEFLYHNPEIREQMGREARKAVEQKKPFGEAVYEIYQEILKREGKSDEKN